MQQLELKLFWPLQEQIPLDLDDCLMTKASSFTCAPSTIINSAFSLTSSNISGSVFTINTDEVVFHTKRPQNLFRRLFFRLLGLRVENVDN
jgi:hypothetical protein